LPLKTKSSDGHASPHDFISFSPPALGEEEIEEVVRCLRSGWITTGPCVARFEEDLGAYFAPHGARTLSSATAGLYLALQALGVGPGDEVITTPLTFAATLNVIELLGATLVLVDVDPLTRNLDLDQVQKAITPRTKVIMPVHIAGLPVDLLRLYEIAGKSGIRVVEDAAHAFGSWIDDDGTQRKVGTFGDIQVLSFHAVKNVTTGEGGAILSKDNAFLDKISVLRFHGMDRPAWNRFQAKGTPYYDVVAPALKFNMMDLQAAIGVHQLAKVDLFNKARARLAQRYLEALTPYQELLEMPPQHPGHNWHLFSPLLNLDAVTISRDTFLEKLKACGVGSSIHYKPVHLFSYYRNKYPDFMGKLLHAEEIGRCTFSLPLHPYLEESQQNRVISEVLDILRKNRR
jgi:dTDP-4-amino-4,6-dideoxygalactose transaminase